MKTEVITDAAALKALEADWWTLYGRILSATPFSSPAWLLPWWDVFMPGTLQTITVRDGGQLVGLAPLYLEHGAEARRLLPLGIGITDFSDVLLDPPHASRAWAAILAELEARADTWDLWSAEELAPDAAALALPVSASWTAQVEPQIACPVLAIPTPYTRAAVPSHKRRTWKLAENRTARRAGEIRPTTAETLGADLDTLFRLHGARWEERGEAGVLAPDAVQQFHRQAAPALLAAGILRMCTLHLGDAIAGAYYGMHDRGRAYAYLTGFDPRFSFESPGTILMGAGLETAAAEGATEFNLLRGQESYKYGWGAVDRWNSLRTFVLRR